MFTRRKFLRHATFVGLTLAALRTGSPSAAAVIAPNDSPAAPRALSHRRSRMAGHGPRKPGSAAASSILDPLSIPKFTEALIIPPAMPRHSEITLPGGRKADYYEIAVRQFQQQILPAGKPATTVWSFGSAAHPNTFNYPAFTIEAIVDRPVRIKWINDLKDPNTGEFLPHLLPVDQTIHWANPPGPRDGHNMDPTPYRGPVPWVTHVHGAHTHDESDGFTEAWYLPAATNIPAGYFEHGTWYEFFRNQFFRKWGVVWEPGTSLWFHDHALGMTRLNVYAGPAGFYLLRGGSADLPPGVLPGPAPAAATSPARRTTRSRSPSRTARSTPTARCSTRTPRVLRGLAAGTAADPVRARPGVRRAERRRADLEPRVLRQHDDGERPHLAVPRGRAAPLSLPRAERLQLALPHPEARSAGLRFWQIGADLGFLRRPSRSSSCCSRRRSAPTSSSTSRRADRHRIVLLNLAPDEPFGGGVPGVDFAPADPGIDRPRDAVPRRRPYVGDTSTAGVAHAAGTRRRSRTPLVRAVSLNEEDSRTVRIVNRGGDGRAARCATIPRRALRPGRRAARHAHGDHGARAAEVDRPDHRDPASTTTESGTSTTSRWTPTRSTCTSWAVRGGGARSAWTGTSAGPEPWETGPKDTVIAYPGRDHA
jgi:spore coat protein A, manganese oxidase